MPLMIKAVKFGKLFLRTHCFQFQLPINYDTEIIKMKLYGESHDQVFINWYTLGAFANLWFHFDTVFKDLLPLRQSD